MGFLLLFVVVVVVIRVVLCLCTVSVLEQPSVVFHKQERFFF